MLKLTGYVDRLSARPGEMLNFKLSNATGAPVEAKFVRVISADPNPAGPGVREEPLSINLPPMDVAEQPVPRGSYGIASLGGALAGLTNFTLRVTIQPTRFPTFGQSTILVLQGADASLVSLTIDAKGHLIAGVRNKELQSKPVALRKWTDVAITYEAATGKTRLSMCPSPGQSARGREATLDVTATHTGLDLNAADATLMLAAPITEGLDQHHFDGRIESPQLFNSVIPNAPSTNALTAEQSIFFFDFAQRISTSEIVDTGPNRIVGRLINHPTRAMRGSQWTGREMCFRHAAHEYAAIHFHADDMTDCQWPTALSWEVPDDLQSGCYALRISAGDQADNIPFFVVPARGQSTAKIAVLVSTYTYTIYANHARPEFRLSERWADGWRKQASEWPTAYPHNPADHPEYAWSTYNDHVDGSGISISSWHRPMLNVRIGYITYPFPDIRASGLRHYQADTHLHTWLEDQGYDFDIITDHELHAEGFGLLKDYSVVVTGSHPEYHTRDMLDALERYRDAGGRFMYLGGNGFYWKIALDSAKDGVIEIRRGEGGIRAWAAEPGEYYNQFDGEYGGLWRRNGRPPQDLCGVGFSAQGNFVGSHYNVNDDARTSRASWILEGLDGSTFGGHGLSGHGAAGFELDRADKDLGTPEHAVILATSEGHEPEAPWVLVPEERLTHITTIPGQTDQELIHSDIVFFETPNHGAVFSVGSITYCGSLLTNGGNNDISRLTKTVLDRFADTQSRFEMP